MAFVLYVVAILGAVIGIAVASFSMDGGGAPLDQVLVGLAILGISYLIGLVAWRMNKGRPDRWPE